MPTYNITQAAGPTNTSATAKPRGVRLKCDPVANSWFDHFEIRRYDTSSDASSDTNPTIIYEGVNANVLDSDELTSGEDYFYKWFWIDQYGNRSAAGTTRSATYRGVSTADIEAGAVSTPALATAAVTPIKADMGDMTNLFKDNNCETTSLWTSERSGAGSLAAITTVANVSGAYGASRGRLQFAFGSVATNETLAVLGLPVNACSAGRRYMFKTFARATTDPGPISVLEFKVDWYGIDASGDKVFISTSTEHDFIATTPSGSTVNYGEFAAIAPAGAAYFAYRLGFDTVGVSGGNYVVEIGGIQSYESMTGVFETAAFSGTESANAGVTKTFMSIVSHHTKIARFVSISFGFKNASGGSRSISIEWVRVDSASVETVLKGPMQVSLQDDNPFYMEFFDAAPGGDSSTYSCRITANGAQFIANSRYMITQAFFG